MQVKVASRGTFLRDGVATSFLKLKCISYNCEKTSSIIGPTFWKFIFWNNPILKKFTWRHKNSKKIFYKIKFNNIRRNLANLYKFIWPTTSYWIHPQPWLKILQVLFVPTMIGNDLHISQLIFQLIKKKFEKIFSWYLSPKQKIYNNLWKIWMRLEALWNI